MSKCACGATIVDFLTGRLVPDTDEELIRQHMEHLLVNEKGFTPQAIEVDREFTVPFQGTEERGVAELVVHAEGRPVMVIKCVKGSLVTRERETLATARLAFPEPVPYAVVTNGQDAEIMDTRTGKLLYEGLEAIFDADEASRRALEEPLPLLDPSRRDKEGRIYMAFADFTCPAECH